MELYEEVFQTMLDTRTNTLRLDPWVSNQAETYAKIRTASGAYDYNGYTFYVIHHPGGGAGMGQHPPTASIFILHKF